VIEFLYHLTGRRNSEKKFSAVNFDFFALMSHFSALMAKLLTFAFVIGRIYKIGNIMVIFVIERRW